NARSPRGASCTSRSRVKRGFRVVTPRQPGGRSGPARPSRDTVCLSVSTTNLSGTFGGLEHERVADDDDAAARGLREHPPLDLRRQTRTEHVVVDAVLLDLRLRHGALAADDPLHLELADQRRL